MPQGFELGQLLEVEVAPEMMAEQQSSRVVHDPPGIDVDVEGQVMVGDGQGCRRQPLVGVKESGRQPPSFMLVIPELLISPTLQLVGKIPKAAQGTQHRLRTQAV